MSQTRRGKSGSGRRTFLKAAAGVTAGTVLTRSPGWAESGWPGAAAFPKIHAPFLMTPDQAWAWNLFKSRGGPTYAGSTGWKRYADALQERAGAIFDANVAADLLVRLGKVSEDHLDDASRAARAYTSAIERMGDDASVLAALDRLFGRLGDTRALADVLERRIAVETDVRVQADLFHRLASLQISEFGEKSQGLATLRQAIAADQVTTWSGGTVEQWADESFHAAQATVYGLLPSAPGGQVAQLGEWYGQMAQPVLERQLEKAGVRLAAILNAGAQ